MFSDKPENRKVWGNDLKGSSNQFKTQDIAWDDTVCTTHMKKITNLSAISLHHVLSSLLQLFLVPQFPFDVAEAKYSS